ncbi:MAG: hypothetical protein A2216_00650 [Omnitrophica WOR_2 bacterium RIFOXYA2_FULL_45_12]|nr:MAG: hypothetical protein A2216_00650 [Omnitrophica WOR_2 bacterium RIFOXYA2_FULL_45_12]OGX60722.1 MAG: hypothetical protein A2471_00825 [Omnitrophica WOR_2 bacterium RIFOXYC2_FULL_45_15]
MKNKTVKNRSVSLPHKRFGLLEIIKKTRKRISRQRQKELREKLIRVKEILTKEFHPQRIYLFGSFIKGNLHSQSDIDIVVEGLGDNWLRAGGRLIDTLGECVDLKPWELLNEDFRREVVKRGKLIYP